MFFYEFEILLLFFYCIVFCLHFFHTHWHSWSISEYGSTYLCLYCYNDLRKEQIFILYTYTNTAFLDRLMYKADLLNFIFDGEFDAAEAGPLVLWWWILVHVTIQNGLHFLRIAAQVQHPYHKVLTLHGQLPIIILQRSGVKGKKTIRFSSSKGGSDLVLHRHPQSARRFIWLLKTCSHF